MAPASSFDVSSTVDLQEVDNAVNQARKEVAQRYDFKGSAAAIEFNKAENTMTLVADDKMKMEALWEIPQTRLAAPKGASLAFPPRRKASCRAGWGCCRATTSASRSSSGTTGNSRATDAKIL